jgi:protoporphyrinogen oxidase
MRDNYSIIGGGISACALAILLNKKNLNCISIYESSSKLGGVLKDLDFDNKIYFNGVQYIQDNTEWINVIKKETGIEFLSLKDINGSYTNLNGEEIYSTEFPCPVFNIKINLEKLPKIKDTFNMKQRLNLYPKEISNTLTNWISKFGIKSELLASQCAENGLMISRVLPLKNSFEQLKNIKEKDKNFDNLYGLPRNILKLPKIKVLVPKQGYNDFFKKLEKYLLSRKINLNLKSIIKSEWSDDKLNIKNISKNINTHKVIWTANPTDLIDNYNSQKLDSLPVMIKTFTADLDVKINNSFYINIFSEELDIFRIYIYNIDNKSKITIECFNKIENVEKHVSKIDKIFLKFGYDIKLNAIKKFYMKKQKKFFLVTIKDKDIISNFNRAIKKTNLISGAWESYHREKKINSMLSQIK